MLQTIGSQTGCLCNPSVRGNNRTHVCTVLRQLAMIWHQCELELLVPTVYQVAMMCLNEIHTPTAPVKRTTVFFLAVLGVIFGCFVD